LAERKAKRRLLIGNTAAVGDDTSRGNSSAATLLPASITPSAQSLTACAGIQNKPSSATYFNSGSTPKSIGVQQQEIAPVCYTDSLFLTISDNFFRPLYRDVNYN
jgi:hypothetical protein